MRALLRDPFHRVADLVTEVEDDEPPETICREALAGLEWLCYRRMLVWAEPPHCVGRRGWEIVPGDGCGVGPTVLPLSRDGMAIYELVESLGDEMVRGGAAWTN